MRKKYIVLLSCLLLCSFVVAQENFDVPVVAGATIESDLITEDINPSATLGAIVSSIQSNVEKFIDFMGVKIWKDTAGSEQVMDFDLVAFPTGSVIDLNDITLGGICATSEEVEIRGVTGIWETSCIEAIVMQVLSGYGDEMVFTDEYTVTINGLYGLYTTDIDWMNNGVPATANAYACSEGAWVDKCPTEAEVEAYFGISFEVLGESNLRYRISQPELDRYVYLVCDELDVLDCDNGENWDFFIEKDNEITTFEFGSSVDGFMTTSNTGQSLMIADAQSYDVYGIIA